MQICYNMRGTKNLLFFKQLKKMRNDENVFNKIKHLNELDTIFPEKIKSTKLNDEIKDIIFKEFRFKYIGKSSSNQKIIKEIFNAYFQKFIINTKQDKNKNITYEIPNKFELVQMYHFGLKFLKTKTDNDDDNSNEINEDIENEEPLLEW